MTDKLITSAGALLFVIGISMALRGNDDGVLMEKGEVKYSVVGCKFAFEMQMDKCANNNNRLNIQEQTEVTPLFVLPASQCEKSILDIKYYARALESLKNKRTETRIHEPKLILYGNDVSLARRYASAVDLELRTQVTAYSEDISALVSIKGMPSKRALVFVDGTGMLLGKIELRTSDMINNKKRETIIGDIIN